MHTVIWATRAANDITGRQIDKCKRQRGAKEAWQGVIENHWKSIAERTKRCDTHVSVENWMPLVWCVFSIRAKCCPHHWFWQHFENANTMENKNVEKALVLIGFRVHAKRHARQVTVPAMSRETPRRTLKMSESENDGFHCKSVVLERTRPPNIGKRNTAEPVEKNSSKNQMKQLKTVNSMAVGIF